MKKLALLLALVSGPSYACSLENMAGKWNLFFGQASCDVVIAKDGQVRKSSCRYGLDDPEKIPLKGRFKMQSSCRLTGKLKLNFISPFGELSDTITIGQSRTNANLEFWTGSLKHDRSNGSSYHTFTAVRLPNN